VTPSPLAPPQLGDAIGELVREPTAAQLFQFSAATWNTHRIHYDRAFALEEGHPDVLVQSHLHACFLAQAVVSTWGPAARLQRIGWQNRGLAIPGDRLTVSGRVVGVERAGDELRADLELQEHNQRGELCVKGWATVVLPRGGP
jgi:hydroxyacyl-ACP dehydratase HTD2-like protein with hotdog domain